jgi:aminomethyltransferase
MTLEFLAPDAAEPFEGAPPVLRSPIEWTHRDAGARPTLRAGWRSVADYGDPAAEAAACGRSVGVADLSHLGKLELQAAPAVAARIVAELAGGASLTLGESALHEDVWWCPITAGRVLAVTPPEATPRVRSELEAAAGREPFASVHELTTALGSNAVVGPLARECFARSTALDMRAGEFGERAFAPVSVARVPGMVLRSGEDAFVHMFGAGYAQYIWTVFVDAAEHLGGRAVGVDALEQEGPADA